MRTAADIPLVVHKLQTDVSNPDVSAWVAANAGSGKTHVLAQRVINLLLAGVAPEKILCLTFTKAAAANMAKRVFDTLARWTTFDDDDLDRIDKEANNTNYGLAASVWTRDLGIAHKLARRIRAGSVWINTHNFGDVALPFGGYKESGWGREMGKEVLELYTETKAVAAAL